MENEGDLDDFVEMLKRSEARRGAKIIAENDKRYIDLDNGDSVRQKQKVSVISETETRKKGGKRKEITEKKTVTETETVTQTVIVSKDKKEDNNNKKEREIADTQLDLDGNIVKDKIINEIEKRITKQCILIREYFKINYFIKDVDMIDVPIAVMVSHMYPGDPVWLGLIGQPSGLKSEILRSAGEPEEQSQEENKKPDPYVYIVSRITQNAVAPGSGDKGLAGRSHGKIVIIKDLVTILTSRYSEQILSQIREMYDGYISTESGLAGGTRSTKTHVTIISGVTPDAVEGNTILRSELGERFLHIRFPKIQKDDLKMLVRKMEDGSSKDEKKRKELGSMVRVLLADIYIAKKWYEKQDKGVSIEEEDLQNMLMVLAYFVAELRKGIIWDWKGNEIRIVGTEEGPARMYKEVRKLVPSLVLVKGSGIVDDNVKKTIIRVYLDSMPYNRFILLQKFMEKYPGNQPIKGSVVKELLARECDFSKSTARNCMLEFMEMNILESGDRGYESKFEQDIAKFADEKLNKYVNKRDIDQTDVSYLKFTNNFIEEHGYALEIIKNYFDPKYEMNLDVINKYFGDNNNNNNGKEKGE